MARPEGKGSKKDKKANGAAAVNGKAEIAKPAVSKDSTSKKSKSKEGPVAAKGKGKAVEPSQQNGDEELDEAALLLREIQSLGGDEADFEFLKDVDNQGEEVDVQGESSEPADDKKLAKELKAFMATLGDLQAAQAELSESEQEAEEAQDDEEEDDDDSEDSTSEEDAETPAAATARAPDKASVSQKPVESLNVASSTEPGTRSGMLVDPHPVWYQIELRTLPEIAGESVAPTPQTITALQTRATQLLTDLSETFSTSLRSTAKDDQLANSSTLSASDRAFISTILQNGTSSDKLSALILLSSSSPLHTTTYLSQLMGLTKKKSRDEAVRAVRAIVDWLKGGQGGGGSAAGLPDRKLRWFADQPDLHKLIHAREGSLKKDNYQLGDEHLLVWAFEDWLKKWYFELLQAIETLSHDPLPFVRNQMVGFLAALLSSKPEQEQNLLRLLVDKLGDSDKTVSSRTSYHLLQLLQAHPMMKTIIVREVASIVLKPANAPVQVTGQKIRFSAPAPVSHSASLRSTDHSKYYGIITLNQIMLTRTPQDKQVANRLIEIYFDIFKDLLGTHDDSIDDVATTKDPELKDRKRRRDEKRGKFAKGSAKDVSRKERRQQEKSQQALEAESKMMAAVLTGVNRAFPYSEINGDVLHQRVDILFRIIHTGTFNVGIQALMLIFQVSSRQQAISDRFYRILYDTLVDSRLAVCSKQAMYLNLVFKAIKADTSSKRVAAFVKRITQILAVHQPPFVCGALYLLGELFGITPSLRSMCTEPEDADDDIENFKDAPEDDASEQEQEEAAPTAANGHQSSKSSHAYDARKRDPQFANAHKTCLWEISPLLNHFHPSVALHASQLLASVPITTTPDLELHTVSHFLDRFVYRNPKKKAEEGGKDSIMKPGAKGSDRSGMVLMRKGVGSITEGRVNADKFIEQASDKVPVDQLFFHKFFNQSKADQAVLESKRDKRKRKDLEDVDGVDADSDLDIDDEDGEEEDEEADAAEAGDTKKAIADDEDASEGDLDEDEVWKAMQANMPDAGEDDADLLQDSGDDVDDDEVDDAEFAYSDSELGVDEDAVAADKGEVEEEEEEEDDDEEVEEDEPKSFFPDEEDDDELEGFAEEDDDVIDSDEDIAIDLPEFPEKASKKSKKGAEKSGGAAEPKNKKRKLKHLPAFASADDWAEIINMGNEDEDM